MELTERIALAEQGTATCSCGESFTDKKAFEEHRHNQPFYKHYAIVPDSWVGLRES
jgi:hypothetical protein